MMPCGHFLNRFKRNLECETFIIAEAGVHHGGSLKRARQLIDAAAKSGADAIKFQTYKARSLVTAWAPKYWEPAGDVASESQQAYFERRDSFGFEDYKALAEYAAAKEIVFCSTPFDLEAIHWLDAVSVPFWKIASADIDNFPLLEAAAKTGKPIILSTGASFYTEIEASVEFLREKGVRELALLHCTLAYPTPDDQANLGRIVELKRRFPDLVIGYSDHIVPDDATMIPALAVALGARVVEKHFTLDRSQPEDDHYHSVDPGLLAKMIRGIKIAEASVALNVEIGDSEWPARENARRSLVAAEPISPGTVLTADLVLPKRPGGGISPALIDKIIGKSVKKTIQKDHQIDWNVLESS
jgi:N-acetylneuraminate synthase